MYITDIISYLISKLDYNDVTKDDEK